MLTDDKPKIRRRPANSPARARAAQAAELAALRGPDSELLGTISAKLDHIIAKLSTQPGASSSGPPKPRGSTAADFCERNGMSIATFYREVKSGRLKATRHNWKWMVPDEVEADWKAKTWQSGPAAIRHHGRGAPPRTRARKAA